MASTIVDPVAEAVGAVLGSLSGMPLKVYYPAVPMADELPAAMIYPPTIGRAGIEEAERQMGAEDWRLDFALTLHFDLSEAQQAQDQGVAYLEAVIAAIDDANRSSSTLAALVDDVKITGAEPDFERVQGRRPEFIYHCTVETLKLVAQ